MKPLYEIIDISEHNGIVDWKKVKDSGIRGVMLRIGWAGYDGKIKDNNAIDKRFEENVKGAYEAGLDIGLYVYSYCMDIEAAIIAAKEVVEIAKRFPGIINMPIAYDVEETDLKCLINQGKYALSENVKAFCSTVENEGYYAMLYIYTAFAMSYLDMNMLKDLDLWIADYRNDEDLMIKELGRDDYKIWQYIGKYGECDGVNGPCDRDYVYCDYPLTIAKLFKNGLFYNPPTGGL